MLSNNAVSLAVVVAFASVAAIAAPSNTFSTRAGAPAIKEIPQSCSLPGVYPYPFSTRFKTTAAFDTAHQIYTYILDEKTVEDPSYDASAHTYQCLEQCYGHGTQGTCKGVLWSYNATHDEYGSKVTGVGCFMYNAPITPADLVGTTDATYTRARAINIEC